MSWEEMACYGQSRLLHDVVLLLSEERLGIAGTIEKVLPPPVRVGFFSNRLGSGLARRRTRSRTRRFTGLRLASAEAAARSRDSGNPTSAASPDRGFSHSPIIHSPNWRHF